jgi:mannobiose 2-epimerase
MLARMRSTAGGMFRTNTWPDGSPVHEHAEMQSTYALAFALFALSAAARVDSSRFALDLALETYRWIEDHLWDERRGGDFELAEPDGSPVESRTVTHLPRRSHNTAMHLFEAFVELARLCPQPEVAASARRVLDWMRQRLFVPRGTFLAHVDLDNRAIDDEVAYGHDVETAHLLIDAANFAPTAVGASEAEELAEKLVDHALLVGWDKSTGSFWSAGTLADGPKRNGRIWWVQAECLYGLLRAAECRTSKRSEYLLAAQQLWNWIREKQLDRELRGWFQIVDPEGNPLDGGIKGQRWKSLYHETRALLYGARSLRRQAQGTP